MCLLLPTSDLLTSSSSPSKCNADWNWVSLNDKIEWTKIIILWTLPKSLLYCCLFFNQLTKLFCLCYLYYLFIQYLNHSLPTFWACKQQLESAKLSKVHLIKAMVLPVAMYGCESWTIKKAECQKIDAFELGCWRRLLRVPWTARRSNQSILKEISPGRSFEGLMLKVKFQYFGHLMRRADSFEKTLMLGKIEGRRRRG